MPFVACDSGGECGSITAARFNTMQYPAITPSIPETSGFVKTKYYSCVDALSKPILLPIQWQ